MLKRVSVLALAGLLALPGAAMAGGATADLESKIDALTRQLEQLKKQMHQMKADNDEIKAANEEVINSIEEKSSAWDEAARFKLYGDFRSRIDYVEADTKAYYTATSVANTMVSDVPSALLTGFFATPPEQRGAMMPALAPYLAPAILSGALAPTPAQDYENDTAWTNRFRLNMRVKAMEDVEFKGRLAMYKSWGMQNNPLAQDPFGPFTLSSMSFDGNISRSPDDSVLYVDRAFINWNNIGGYPVWFSVGRRPTTDGPPSQLRLGADQKLATPTAFMDYAFDGATIGYAYNNLLGLQDFPGRIRFCYGRGFEAGPTYNDSGLNDVDFAGINWDVYKKGDRFFNFQSFGAFNMFNVPDNVTFPNPLEIAMAGGNSLINNVNDLAAIQAGNADGILNRANLGDIYHTSFVYMDKYQNLNYFLAGAWSRTDPRGWDEMGNSLLVNWWGDLDEKDGYAIYVGGRYDLPDYGLKLGLEFNWGSEDWIAFTPAHDDLYASKLAVRGQVYEAYGIWDIPAGEAISKYAKAFVRLGYQHYEYDYTGSGYWLGKPVDMDELTNSPLNAQLYSPVDSMDQVYLSLEAWF